MKTILTSLSLILCVSSAEAYPMHLFWCAVGRDENKKQVYFEIEDANISQGIGKIVLSNWVIPPDEDLHQGASDCGMLDGPCKKLVSARWVPFEQAQVRAKLTWSENNAQPVIIGIQVDMGRSGLLEAFATRPMDQYNSAPGKVIANVMGFNYPNGINADHCNYFKSQGPKPGLTGSN